MGLVETIYEMSCIIFVINLKIWPVYYLDILYIHYHFFHRKIIEVISVAPGPWIPIKKVNIKVSSATTDFSLLASSAVLFGQFLVHIFHTFKNVVKVKV